MKKPAKKPLRLETQTIRSLDRQTLAVAVGGALPASRPAVSCTNPCEGGGGGASGVGIN